eukprot:5242016-Prorocentrum_lima.AAC.1
MPPVALSGTYDVGVRETDEEKITEQVEKTRGSPVAAQVRHTHKRKKAWATCQACLCNYGSHRQKHQPHTHLLALR